MQKFIGKRGKKRAYQRRNKTRKKKKEGSKNLQQGDTLVGRRGREGKNKRRTERKEKGWEENKAISQRGGGEVISDLVESMH